MYVLVLVWCKHFKTTSLQRDEILKLAESCNANEAAIFLRQCYSNSQVIKYHKQQAIKELPYYPYLWW